MSYFLSELSKFSFRKLAALCVIGVFTVAQLGWLWKFGFKELPTAYVAVDTAVILSYFSKEALSRISFGNKKHQRNNDTE